MAALLMQETVTLEMECTASHTWGVLFIYFGLFFDTCLCEGISY